MAVPPNIPTSFVPRPTMSQRSPVSNIAGGFRAVSIGILLITLVLAATTGAYAWYLQNQLQKKDAALVTAEASVDSSSVQTFVRLQNRLTSARTLLDGHVNLSNFLSALEAVTLAHMRFTSLIVNVLPDHTATISVAGSASSFNALAAESAKLATNSLIKDAVFSGIAIDKSGGVNFNLNAMLDTSLVVESTAGAAAKAPATASSSPTTP